MRQLALDLPPRRLTVLDLCCGAGMASMGIASAGGFRILGGVDIWAEALEVMGEHFEDSDEDPVEYEDGDDIGPVDVVVTGPPCQDDSRANQGEDQGRGDLKRWALDCAKSYGPTWIVMEMVTREWSPWCLENGARQILRLKDCECGGFTQRTRWFAIWGPRDLEVPTLPQEKWKGWGQALLCFDRGARLSTEANSKAKRWKYFKAWQEPAHAVVGGDRRVVIRMSDGEEWRLPPSEAAALQGFPLLQLPNGLTDREAQTMVGNGWPRSFGLALGRAIKEVS